MISKITLLFMIVSTLGIFSSGVGTASAFSFDTITLNIFDKIGKGLIDTGKAMVCVISISGDYALGRPYDVLEKPRCDTVRPW